ncbi:Sporulation and spore germination [Alkalibacterium subtropicum]|uniref:Sporulation and spore germination n=1 Tax=Alkalibacterium subtropicum TaxID=753702 RepID=A0A1I1GN78_9LACT|nr:GerMN domain-containing protein [Alkalibacterium subtropicum]SFC13064.1 Sporulation and spore germination [Alkalibacterium subtropicum]
MKQLKMTRLLSSLLLSGVLLAGCGWFNDPDMDTEDPDMEEETPSDENGSAVPEDAEGDPGEETDPEDETEDDDQAEVDQDLTVWFPKFEDTLMDYEGEGNEFAPFTRYPQFVKDESIQIVESTGGTDVVTIYEYSENEVREVFIRPETYFREDFADTGLESEQEDFEIILQLPLEEGHSWESPSGSTSEITGVAVDKALPSGNVTALEVTRTSENGSETVEYYAEDIGLVERVFRTEEGENIISSTLNTRAENTPEEFPLTVYSVDDQAMGLERTSVTMELYTNEPARLAMAEILRGQAPDTETARVIVDSTEINFMYLRQDGVVHADFSVDLADMNAGSGVEALILQGIVNTIGSYYNVEDVLLTLDNEPYESGHIALEEGETLSVDYSNINE